METQTSSLTGRRVFLVEDEALLTMLLEDFLEQLGCELAGSASRLPNAMQQAQTLSFDIAILDVNLNGEQTAPIAELLRSRGTPFVFATGYGMAGVPAHLQTTPVVKKPFQMHELKAALCEALSSTSSLSNAQIINADGVDQLS
jgi:CheY-like chemotaxis protein